MEYTAVIKVPFDQSGYDDGHRGDFCPHTCTVLVDVTMDTCWDFTGEPTLTVLIAAASPASNFLLTSHADMHVTTACMSMIKFSLPLVHSTVLGFDHIGVVR